MEQDMETADLLAAKAKAMLCNQDHYLLDSAGTDLEFDRIPSDFKREMANMEDWLAPSGVRALLHCDKNNIDARSA
eukprot:2858178-Heterocapsa_arctica.AAC.1